MKFHPASPPRIYEVGRSVIVHMQDCGRVHLEPDEQLTFQTESGAEYDLARKDWGFYATPSLNGRLQDFGLRAVMVKNLLGRYFVLLVERGKEPLFDQYVAVEELQIVTWMDNAENLQFLERALALARAE